MRTGLQGSSRLPKVVLAIVGVWGALAGVMLIHTLLATKQLHKRVGGHHPHGGETSTRRPRRSSPDAADRTRSPPSCWPPPSRSPPRCQEMNGVTAGLAAKVDSILAGSTTIQTNSQAIEGHRRLRPRHRRRRSTGRSRASGRAWRASWPRCGRRRRRRGRSTPRPGASTPPWPSCCRWRRSIDAGIGASNRGIGAAAVVVDALRADIGNILATMPDIAKHANSIDCHSVLQPPRPAGGSSSQACNGERKARRPFVTV